MKRLLSCAWFLLVILNCFAQDPNLKFASYLYKKGYFREALLELHLQSGTGKYQKEDSLQYYTGICFLGAQQKDTAIALLGSLNERSSFCNTGKMFASLLLAESMNYSKAFSLLETVNTSVPRWSAALAYQKDALGLLEKRDTVFESKDPEYRRRLFGFRKTMMKYHRRSPVVGGLLSAIIPGLGKVYAGKPRHFPTALVPLSIMALQAYEGYNHKGLRSARFWVFGSAFTVFYLGNIYGSSIAVRVAKKEQYDLAKDQILVDMRFTLHDLIGDLWK